MGRLKLYWKPFLIFIITLLSFISFLHFEREDAMAWEKPLRALYYSFYIFLMGGSDIISPRCTSPLYTVILWICYFLAPLLSISFVYEFVQEKFLNRIPRRLRNHTIICGLGRNGRLIYQLVRETLPANHKIVIIEKDIRNPYS